MALCLRGFLVRWFQGRMGVLLVLWALCCLCWGRGGVFFFRAVWVDGFFLLSLSFSLFLGVEWTGLDWTSLDEPEVRQMVPNPLPFLFKYTCARNARADRRKLHRQTVAATYACIVALALASP